MMKKNSSQGFREKGGRTRVISMESEKGPAESFIFRVVELVVRQILGSDPIAAITASARDIYHRSLEEGAQGQAVFFGHGPIRVSTRTGVQLLLWLEVHAREKSWYYARATVWIKGKTDGRASFFVERYYTYRAESLRARPSNLVFPMPRPPKKRKREPTKPEEEDE